MRALMAVVVGVGAVVTGFYLGAGPARAVPPSPETGAEIAARWCAACHVIAPSGAGTDAAPSFLSIAHRRETDELKLFLAEPHALAMRGFNLTTREIDDVVAYIQTLEQHGAR